MVVRCRGFLVLFAAVLLLTAPVAAAPAPGGSDGFHATTGQAPSEVAQDGDEGEGWNLSVDRVGGTDPELVARSENYRFHWAVAEDEDSNAVGADRFHPSIEVVRNESVALGGERETVANVIVDHSRSIPVERGDGFRAQAVGDALAMVYRDRVLVLSEQGGEWTVTRLDNLSAPIVDVSASDTGFYVTTEERVTAYRVAGTPRRTASYDAEYEIQAADFADGTLTFDSVDRTVDGCSGGQGCAGQQIYGGYVRSLDASLEERWSRDYEGDGIVYYGRVGGTVAVTDEGSTSITGVDAATGEELWTWDHPSEALPLLKRVDDSLHVSDPQVETTYVLDARSGEEVWSYSPGSVIDGFRNPHGAAISHRLGGAERRFLFHDDGEYVLRDASTGDVLGRYEGPRNPVTVLSGGQYVALMADPAPSQTFVEVDTGRVVAEQRFGEDVTAEYQESGSGLIVEPGSTNLDERFSVAIRDYKGDRVETALHVQSPNGTWLRLASQSDAHDRFGDAVYADNRILTREYRTELEDDKFVGYTRLELWTATGTYLGTVAPVENGTDRPLSQVLPAPDWDYPLDRQENYTTENYDIGLEYSGDGTPYLLYEDPGYGDIARTERFVVAGLEPRGDTPVRVSVRCSEGTLEAEISNPNQFPVEYAVSSGDSDRLAAGATTSLELTTDREHDVTVTVGATELTHEVVAASEGVEVGDDGSVRGTCSSTPTMDGPSSQQPETGQATPGSAPGLGVCAALVAVLLVAAGRVRRT